MVDKVDEETTPPTLVLGLGEFGTACLKKMKAGAALSAPNWSLVSVRGVSISAGISLASEDGLASIGFPIGDGNRAPFYHRFRADSESLVDWLKVEVERLGRAGASSTSPGRIKVLVVAKAEEIDGSAIAVALPELIKDQFDGFVANWPVTLAGFFLLPKGKSTRGAQVFSFLEELRDGRRGYDHTFFISEANVGRLIGEDGAADLIAGFADLMTETRFDAAVAETMDVSGATAAGVGLTCLVHPVENLIADETARFARELVKNGILSGATDSFYRLADEYLRTEGFEAHALKDRLLMDEEGDIPDRLSIEAADLKGVPLSLWADRIAGDADYLAHERMPRLLGRMEANLADLSRRAETAVAARVDDLMTESAGVDKALRFVERLDERSAELREKAQAAAKIEADQVDNVSEFQENLVERLKNYPESIAVAARTLILAPVAYFFWREFVGVLANFPDQYINPAYVPPAVPAALAGLGFTLAFMFLLYRRAEDGLDRAKDLYMSAIDRKYRGALERSGWMLLDRWLGGSWSELIAAEHRSLIRFKKEYLLAVSALEKAASFYPADGVNRSVLAVFGRRSGLRYKHGRYDIAGESERFAVGGHRHWRSTGADALRGSLEEFCRHGLSFADKRSVDTVVFDLMADKGKAAALMDDLRRRARPFTALSADYPAIIEVAAVPGGRQSLLVLETELFKEATVVTAARPHKLAFAQLVCPIKATDFAAFAEWRQAYKGCSGLAELVCRDEAA